MGWEGSEEGTASARAGSGGFSDDPARCGLVQCPLELALRENLEIFRLLGVIVNGLDSQFLLAFPSCQFLNCYSAGVIGLFRPMTVLPQSTSPGWPES